MILFTPIFLYYFGYNYYLIATEKFLKKNDANSIYFAIKKSKKTTNKKKIIISDSMGGQLFPVSKKYDSIYTLSTTAPASLVGSYILIKNLLKRNNLKGRTIYYIAHPTSLSYDLREPHTYNHFIKPFFLSDNYKYISSTADSLLRFWPFLHAAQLPFVKTTNWQPEFEFKKDDRIQISKLYLEYFKKIILLSKEEKFDFFVLMPFLQEKEKNESYLKIKEQVAQHKLDNIFSKYFEKTPFLASKFFIENDMHYNSKNLNLIDEKLLFQLLN
jgi:hypothetical protein